jgi:RNA:NAD 2'-phosphotransferase (TPT1/KptA family)
VIGQAPKIPAPGLVSEPPPLSPPCTALGLPQDLASPQDLVSPSRTLDLASAKKLGVRVVGMLRHGRHRLPGQVISPAGWMKVSEVLEAMRVTKRDLDDAVAASEGRLELSTFFVRATDGHTIDVSISYEKVAKEHVPHWLYHRTQRRKVASVLERGLMPASALQEEGLEVHPGRKFAYLRRQVGDPTPKRPVALQVEAYRAADKFGVQFYYGRLRDLYLTDMRIPGECISEIARRG